MFNVIPYLYLGFPNSLFSVAFSNSGEVCNVLILLDLVAYLKIFAQAPCNIDRSASYSWNPLGNECYC